MTKLLFFLVSIASAAITNVRVEPTHAQAVIFYTAPTTAVCSIKAWDMNIPIEVTSASQSAGTVTVNTRLTHAITVGQSIYIDQTGVWDGEQTVASVTDNDTFTFSSGTSGSVTTGAVGVLVHDINTALFSGADLDSRAGANQNGRYREFVLGSRLAQIQSGTADSYSRSLQTNSLHRYLITCGGDTYAGSFYTKNIPLGTLAVDRPVPAAPGKSAWPSLDKSGRWEKSNNVFLDRVIDPITGVLYTQMYPPEIVVDTAYNVSTTNTPTPTGANWTNPGNVRTNDSTSATYAAATQDPLCVRPYLVTTTSDNSKAGWYTSNLSLENVTTTIRGSGAGSGADGDVEVALSIDGCQTAATDWKTIDLTGSLTSVSFPSGTPKGGFADWHGGTQRRLNHIDVVTRRNYVNTSGTDVSLRPELGAFTHMSTFAPDDWKAGSKIRIGGTSTCADGTEYDIASVTNQRNLVLQSSAGTQTGAWWCGANFAVMVRKKTTSTDQIDIDYVNFSLRTASNVAGHDSGSAKIFSETSVTDGDGNVGYLSMSPGVGGSYTTFHWVSKDNGESRAIMAFLSLAAQAGTDGWTSGNCGAAENSFIAAEPDAFICVRDANAPATGKVMVKVKIWWDGTGRYKSQSSLGSIFSTCSTTSPASPNPCVTVENIHTGYTLEQLIEDRNAEFDSTKYTCGIRGVQGSIVSMGCSRSVQDTVGWIVAYDFTKPIADYDPMDQNTNPVKGAVQTTHEAFGGFTVVHTGWTLPGTSRYVAVNPKFGRKNSAATNQNGEGPWAMRVSGGTALNSTTDVHACPANPWNYANCSTIVVTSHPFDPDPGAGETGAVGEYGEAKVGYGIKLWQCDTGAAGYTHETYAQENQTTTGCHADPNGEDSRIVAMSGTAPTITLEIARPARGSIRSHNAGYSVYMYPLNQNNELLADVTAMWDVEAAPSGSTDAIKYVYGQIGHGAFNARAFVGDISTANYGNIVYPNPTPATIAALPPINLFVPGTWPTFAGKLGNRYGNDIQNYNAVNHTDFPAARANAYNFYFDARPWMAQLITSTHYLWEKVAGKTYIYKYNKMADGTYQYPYTKILPLQIFSSNRQMTEISGPSSTLNDNTTDHWKQCEAYRADECQTGSSPGDVFINLPYAYTTGTADYRCYNGVYAWNEADICTQLLDPMLGPNIQYYYGNNTDMGRGRHVRKLGWGLVEQPKMVNKVPKIYPTGEWLGPLWTNWLNMHRSSGALLMKLPPIPTEDGYDRTTFIPMSFSVGSVPAGTSVAQIEFGYNDFGTPAQLYCTSRAESCLATGSKVIGDTLVTSPWTTSNTNASWQFINSTVEATTPIRVTTTTAHKFTSDVKVRSSSNTSGLNPKLWSISLVDSDTFELVGSTSGDVGASSTQRVFVPKYDAPFAFSGESFSVAGATNATPIEISTATMHRFQTGSRVCISGVGGNTAANGCHTITATGPSVFTLDGVAGNGSYTSGGSVTPGGVACTSDCTVTIPGVTGRVLYYRWRYLDSTGTVIATGNTNTTVVP